MWNAHIIGGTGWQEQKGSVPAQAEGGRGGRCSRDRWMFCTLVAWAINCAIARCCQRPVQLPRSDITKIALASSTRTSVRSTMLTRRPIRHVLYSRPAAAASPGRIGSFTCTVYGVLRTS